MNKRNSLGIGIIVILSIFIVSILILSRAFVSAKVRSDAAARLSDAVFLSGNCAEVFLSCDSDEELASVLNEADNVLEQDGITVFYDEGLHPAKDGVFRVKITVEEKDGFRHAKFVTSYQDQEIYVLETGREGQ